MEVKEGGGEEGERDGQRDKEKVRSKGEMRRGRRLTNDLSVVLQLSTQLANFCKGWVIFGSNIDHWNTTVEKSS